MSDDKPTTYEEGMFDHMKVEKQKPENHTDPRTTLQLHLGSKTIETNSPSS